MIIGQCPPYFKEKPMEFTDLEDFIKCYNPSNRHDRKETWSEDNPQGNGENTPTRK